MPVFCNLQKGLTFKRIQKFGSDFRLIFENPSHFSVIFRPKKVKISLRNFRISLLDSGITLSNPKISLLDFRGVKIFAEIPQICVLFCRKSRVKIFTFSSIFFTSNGKNTRQSISLYSVSPGLCAIVLPACCEEFLIRRQKNTRRSETRGCAFLHALAY